MTPVHTLLVEARLHHVHRQLNKAIAAVEKAVLIAKGVDLVRAHLIKGRIMHTIARYTDKAFFEKSQESLETAKEFLAKYLEHKGKTPAIVDLNAHLNHEINLALANLSLSKLDEYKAEYYYLQILANNQQPVTSNHIMALLGLSRLSADIRNDYKTALEYAETAIASLNKLKAETPKPNTEQKASTPNFQPTINQLEAEVYFQLSQMHIRRQEYDLMEEYSKPLLDLSRKLGDVEKEVLALCNLAVGRSVKSDYQTGMSLLLESLEKSQKIGFRFNIANCLINIGTIHAQLFNYEDALDRYQTVLNDYKNEVSEATRLAISSNIGNIYYTIEQYDLSIDYFNTALRLANDTHYKELIAHNYAQLSRSNLAVEDWESANRNAAIAAELLKELGDEAKGTQNNLLNQGEIEWQLGNASTAEALIKKGIALAGKVIDTASELRGYRLLARLYEKENNFRRAFKCQEIIMLSQEDYARKQRQLRLLDSEIQYSLKEKQRKIEQLTKENQFQALLLERNSQIAKQNEQLVQMNEELRQFAYITSHDLKEPLRMIGSFTQLIQQQVLVKNQDEQVSTYFQYVKEGVFRMNGLLDGLLQYATIGKMENEKEEVSMSAVVSAACSNLKIKIQETNTQILVTKDSLPNIQSVETLLIQLFQNLISNGIKFCQPDQDPIITIDCQERNEDYLFKVTDNGIGIDKEHWERIFVIFQRLHTRTRYEGTGIGLAICYKIVQQLGGKIWVESEIGKGTSFLFTLSKTEQ
jgi:signal transduction histidine kinase